MKLSIILELQCVDDIRYVLCSYRNMRKTTSENALSLSLRLFSLSFCLSLNIYTGIRIFSLISFLLFKNTSTTICVHVLFVQSCVFVVQKCIPVKRKRWFVIIASRKRTKLDLFRREDNFQCLFVLFDLTKKKRSIFFVRR